MFTSEPYGSSMLILVDNSVFCPAHVDGVVDHPDGGEEEEDDEINLQIWGADFNMSWSAATD